MPDDRHNGIIIYDQPPPPALKKKCTGRLMGHMAHLGMEQHKSRPGDHCSKKRLYISLLYHIILTQKSLENSSEELLFYLVCEL